MAQNRSSQVFANFEWIDIINPSKEEFAELINKYKLVDEHVDDCMQIGHLPKIEEHNDYQFIIIRSLLAEIEERADTLIEITSRISIFYNDKFIITVRKSEVSFLDELKNLENKEKKFKSTKALVNLLVFEAIKTFENFVLSNINPKLDEYEDIMFLQRRNKPLLKKLYYIKRQINVIRSILVLNQEIIDYLNLSPNKSSRTQDLRDLFARTNTLYKNESENTSQLLSIYFNIESNHTNEIMRTLTIISMFFLPLTFIVGIYGMNFKNMPELEWYYGYPIIMLSMLILSIAIYAWFKRKKWL